VRIRPPHVHARLAGTGRSRSSPTTSQAIQCLLIGDLRLKCWRSQSYLAPQICTVR
jgi:hypothetical protein